MKRATAGNFEAMPESLFTPKLLTAKAIRLRSFDAPLMGVAPKRTRRLSSLMRKESARMTRIEAK